MLDHVGFEVEGLEEVCKKLARKDIRFDIPFSHLAGMGVFEAALADPWGTSFSLTEGLDAFWEPYLDSSGDKSQAPAVFAAPGLID